MTPNITITRDRIRNHFHYFWWQYALLIALAIFGWNLLYTTTRYRAPAHLKMDWFYEGSIVADTQQKADALMADLTAQLFPDMEEVGFTVVGLDENYGSMQIMVWMAAGEGDLYMLAQDSFPQYAQGGSMLDLTPWVEDGTLNVEGLELKRGYVRDEDTGERYLCGIPAGHLTGLNEYGIFPENTYLSVLSNGGNTDNTIKLMSWLLENMRE